MEGSLVKIDNMDVLGILGFETSFKMNYLRSQRFRGSCSVRNSIWDVKCERIDSVGKLTALSILGWAVDPEI